MAGTCGFPGRREEERGCLVIGETSWWSAFVGLLQLLLDRAVLRVRFCSVAIDPSSDFDTIVSRWPPWETILTRCLIGSGSTKRGEGKKRTLLIVEVGSGSFRRAQSFFIAEIYLEGLFLAFPVTDSFINLWSLLLLGLITLGAPDGCLIYSIDLEL